MTTINNPIPKDQLRSPRGFVSINGQQVQWDKFEVSNTRYSAAGTFKVTIPVSSLPKSLSLNTLITTAPLTVQINAGIPTQSVPSNATPSDLPMLISGNADEVLYEPDKTMVTISGRDNVSLFLDNKLNQLNNPIGPQIQSIFNFSKSSDIVKMIAQHRGLMATVTETSQPIGTYLPGGSASSVFSQLSSQITEWDLMVFLAREENYDLYVVGNTLFFQPRQNSNTYQITLTIPYFTTSGQIPTSNVMSIQLKRNLRLAKDLVVQVTSWNIHDKVPYTKIATLKHAGSTGSAPPLIYNYRFPNLSQDQCTQKAQSLLADISQHEFELNAKMPGSTLLTAHSTIAVKDTNSLYDQIYYVKNVTREMDFNGGFIMNIEAKTTPPSNTVTLQ